MNPKDIERFLTKFDQGADCWHWKMKLSAAGYGMFTWREGAEKKRRYAHRVSYEHFVGPISQGLEIDHLCENPACVNPAHLEPVQHWVNNARSAHRQTHCKRGHEMTDDNTYRSGDRRWCRECAKVKNRAYQARLRKARLDDLDVAA